MAKILPVGISDYKKLIDENCYYIDKSLLIKEILDTGAEVMLFPRPRRFGKTINLSMLRYFFEKSDEDRNYLFKDLKIENAGTDYNKHQGKYPVIYLTFKDVKQDNKEQAYKSLIKTISKLYKNHDYLLESSVLDQFEKENYTKIIKGQADLVNYEMTLKDLSEYLERYYQEKVFIMIDEYDAPIQSGYLNGFYDSIIKFMRNFLSGGLKDNTSLKKGILTGILRVAKESIFSGLNNLSVYTLLNSKYNKYFGLLEEETQDILEYYGMKDKLAVVKEWYNGYSFGGQIVYNPWSIIKYIENNGEIRAYWVNTSSNNLIKKLISRHAEVKEDLELLLKGNSIQKEISEDIVYGEIDRHSDYIWSFFLLSGYLKAENVALEKGKLICDLRIPNQEVFYLFENIIRTWFKESIENKQLDILLNSLTSGDIETFEVIFQEFVINSMSIFDTGGKEPEKVYHAFVLGMLVYLSDQYEVKSNRESGYGRYDVMLIPKDKNRLGIVMEFKKVNNYRHETLDEALDKALKQIEERKYSQELVREGVKEIIELGLAFSGKVVKIRERRRKK
ncbi:MAG: AAA family ATPase [Halanaerobiales bacterium]|nr:AAA family ATPase [Halanaerobiales bacterium]